jgi:hypothetical protein
MRVRFGGDGLRCLLDRAIRTDRIDRDLVAIESASGPGPTSVSLPVLGSIANVTAEYGSLRKPT